MWEWWLNRWFTVILSKTRITRQIHSKLSSAKLSIASPKDKIEFKNFCTLHHCHHNFGNVKEWDNFCLLGGGSSVGKGLLQKRESSRSWHLCSGSDHPQLEPHHSIVKAHWKCTIKGWAFSPFCLCKPHVQYFKTYFWNHDVWFL